MDTTSIRVSGDTRDILKSLRYSIHEKYKYWLSNETIIKELALRHLEDLKNNNDRRLV